MKHFIIVFILFNVNHSYSQRFINNQPFVNVTYNPRSLDEMSRLPLMKMKIAEENSEKIRALRKELYRIKEGIKINQEKYHPTINGINDLLYKLITEDHDLADPGITTIIRQTSTYIDETINKYNEDIRIYNDRKKYNY